MRGFCTLRWFFPALALLATAAPAHAVEPLTIPVIVSLSGGGAFLGSAEQRAVQIAQKVVNASGGVQGRPVSFDFHDGQTSPQVDVQLANGLIAAHPAVIIGPSLVSECNATAPLARSGPVMYCFAPGIHPAAGSFVFSTDTSTHDLEAALVRYLRARGMTRIAVVTSTDGSGQDAERGIKEVFALPENKDMQIVENAHFGITDLSVSAQIDRIKAASPQALIAWSTGSPIGTVFRAIQQAGLDVPVATTDGNMTYAQMKQFASILPRELYIPSSPWMVGDDPRIKLDPAVIAKQAAFMTAMHDEGIEPDIANLLGWEPAMLVLTSLQKIGPDATAAQLKDYLSHLKGYSGLSGTYDFEASPQRGLSSRNALVTRWDAQKNRWVPVSQLGGAPLP